MYDDEGQRKLDREEYARSHAMRAKISWHEQDEQLIAIP